MYILNDSTETEANNANNCNGYGFYEINRVLASMISSSTKLKKNERTNDKTKQNKTKKKEYMVGAAFFFLPTHIVHSRKMPLHYPLPLYFRFHTVKTKMCQLNKNSQGWLRTHTFAY